MFLKLVEGDVFKAFQTIESDSVDLVLTSPPYWGLRSYGVEGELGAEPTLEAYLDNLMRWVKESWRVLKPTGSFVLNLGGCYCGGGRGTTWGNSSVFREGKVRAFDESADTHLPETNFGTLNKGGFYKSKQFLDVGAFAYQRIISETDFVCRNRGVWCKPNVPSPIRSRLKQSTESVDWFVKDAKEYYFNAKPWLRKVTEVSHNRGKYPVNMEHFNSLAQDKETKAPVKYPIETIEHSWRVVPVGEKQKGFELSGKEKQEHVAPFPEALVKPWIESLTPQQVCAKCGKPWKPVYENTGSRTAEEEEEEEEELERVIAKGYPRQTAGLKVRSSGSTVLKEWKPSCDCEVEFVAGTVLDPFLGSGTVLKIARDLRLNAVGFDLNEDYLNYAKKRVNWGESLSGYEYEFKEAKA